MEPKPKLIPVSTYLPPDLHKELKRLAVKDKRSIAQFLLLLIEESLVPDPREPRLVERG